MPSKRLHRSCCRRCEFSIPRSHQASPDDLRAKRALHCCTSVAELCGLLLKLFRSHAQLPKRGRELECQVCAMLQNAVFVLTPAVVAASTLICLTSSRAFKVMVDDLEVSLREAAARQPEYHAAFNQPGRPPDAYRLGNHPAFRGVGGVGGFGGQNGEMTAAAGAAGASNMAARKRDGESIVLKVILSSGFYIVLFIFYPPCHLYYFIPFPSFPPFVPRDELLCRMSEVFVF